MICGGILWSIFGLVLILVVSSSGIRLWLVWCWLWVVLFSRMVRIWLMFIVFNFIVCVVGEVLVWRWMFGCCSCYVCVKFGSYWLSGLGVLLLGLCCRCVSVVWYSLSCCLMVCRFLWYGVSGELGCFVLCCSLLVMMVMVDSGVFILCVMFVFCDISVLMCCLCSSCLCVLVSCVLFFCSVVDRCVVKFVIIVLLVMKLIYMLVR